MFIKSTFRADVVAASADEIKRTAVSGAYASVWKALPTDAWLSLSGSGLRRASSAELVSSSRCFPPGCFFISTDLHPQQQQQQQESSDSFSCIVVSINCVRYGATDDADASSSNNSNNSNNTAEQSLVTAICAVALAPALLRRAPMSLRHLPPPVVADIAAGKFVALSAASCDAGLGDWSAGTCAAEEQCSLAGWVLPSMRRVRVLAVGRTFPRIDDEMHRLSSEAAAGGQDPQQQNRHLDHVRRRVGRAMLLARGVGSADAEFAVPEWMVPSKAADVEFWCALAYETTADDSVGDGEDNEHDDHQNNDMSKFLVPSSLLWGALDVRCPLSAIPPRFHAELLRDLQNFSDQISPAMLSAMPAEAATSLFVPASSVAIDKGNAMLHVDDDATRRDPASPEHQQAISSVAPAAPPANNNKKQQRPQPKSSKPKAKPAPKQSGKRRQRNE